MDKTEAYILPPEGEGEFSSDQIVKIWKSILKKRWILLTITALAAVMSVLIAFSMQDFYTAEAQVLVQKISNEPVMHKEAVMPDQRDEAYYKTQVQIIKGYALCKSVVQELGLVAHYDAKSVIEAARILQEKIRATLIRDTRIITLKVQDREPRWAAKIADKITVNYTKQSLADQLFVSEQILKWFPDEAKTVQDASPIEILRKLDDDDAMMSLPSVTNDPTIGKLRQQKIELEAKERELLTTYTPEHPNVKEIAGRLAYIESEMLIQARRITASLKMTLSGQFNVSRIKILQKAEIPSERSGPHRMLFILAGTALGFLISIIIIAFLESVDKTIRSDEDLVGVTDVPLVGQIPEIRLGRGKRDATQPDLILNDLLDDVVVSDAFATLKTALIFSMPQGMNKKIMVTSSVPGEGKSTVSYLLAASMAKLGEKVLLVEMDLRRPILSRIMHKSRGFENRGLCDYLVGQAELKDIIFDFPKVPGMDYIMAGQGSPNPAVLFSSSTFEKFLSDMEQRYDRVIVDTPPSYAIPDPVMISGKVHGLLFVIGAGKVHRKIVSETLRKFKLVKSMVFGMVINRVSEKTSEYYEKYGYYYQAQKKPSA